MIKSIPLIWWIAPLSSVIASLSAYFLYKKLLTASEGTDRMKEIAGFIKEGAMAYLTRQYKTVSIVFALLFIILSIMAFIGIQSPFVPFVFISGGILSGLSGYLGMKTATNASARTAAGCQKSLNEGLKISFRGGAVMGLLVVGFGLLGISFWFVLLNYLFDNNCWGISNPIINSIGISEWYKEITFTTLFQKAKYVEITSILLTYAMGASAMALFARVGGGIFTKAADMGADLVGKVEAGIPEDDPRNPATIADNVGDNVGDVAGMGADLYESYCGSILAASALGASLAISFSGNLSYALKLITAPMIVAGGGIIFSLIGIYFVKTKEQATQKSLLHSLLFGTILASVLTLIFIGFLAKMNIISWGIFGAVLTGLLAGIIIGQATEYYTSSNYEPTKTIAQNCSDGPANTVLSGISTGMLSTAIPVITTVTAIMTSFYVSGGSQSISKGVYGIAFAAIGMLSTLGIQLATDAFGPIADNAGGNAEMSGLPPEVREKTDALDTLGNTTAATGKGFAIGSAALTALALIATYLDTIKLSLSKLAGNTGFKIGSYLFTNNSSEALNSVNIIDISSLDIATAVEVFKINAINPKFISGLFLGAMLAFIFCALTIKAVGNAASKMVNEVRRQFKEIKGILEGKAQPDYARCVDISTTGAQKAMLLPSLLAISAPIVVGLILHIPGVIGLLCGSLVTGFLLAMMLNNSGGAWDNAKKYIESGEHGGKGTDAHKSAIIGDTIGDPFKDTSGPALNILIKLMTIVSIVFAGFTIKFGLFF